MKRKKVLIITYYWPPSGGAGVQRWLKFTKYLPEYGWDPIIYTPENPEAPVEDLSLLNDIPKTVTVIKRPIWEPYHLYKKFIGMDQNENINAGFLTEHKKPRKKEDFSVWIRGNFFIPDARKYWIRPSVKFLKNYLTQNPVDIIVSTGPPHSMHLIPLKLKKYFNIPWVVDFRDPWINIDFYEQLKLTSWAHTKHTQLEKKVLRGADNVIVVGPTMGSYLKQKCRQEPQVIPNGFDHCNFEGIKIKPDSTFTISHVGSMNKDRNLELFWKCIAELTDHNQDLLRALKIKLVGKLDVSVSEHIQFYGLEKYVEKQSYLPHDQIAPLLMNSWLLYLPINNTPNSKSIQTGKLFEYLASNRPIVGVGPSDGDAAHILLKTGAGKMIDYHDSEGLKTMIMKQFHNYMRHDFNWESRDIQQYSRKALTGMLSKILTDTKTAS